MKNDLEREYIQFIENLRRDTRNRFHHSAMRWNELSNDRAAQVSKQLFTISSLILPLSFFPITNNDLVNSLSPISKTFLVSSWILFILSLIFGLVHLTKEANFFNLWAEQENKRGKIYSEGIFVTSALTAYDRLEKMNKASDKEIKMQSQPSKFWFYLQEVTMVLGVVVIAFILFGILYSTNPTNSENKNQKWQHYNSQKYFRQFTR